MIRGKGGETARRWLHRLLGADSFLTSPSIPNFERVPVVLFDGKFLQSRPGTLNATLSKISFT